ncbi:peptidase M20 [Sphingomonadales bacterium EhC05]|nr:peptidase M20 [Sphingomonadales bacterium EhC05]
MKHHLFAFSALALLGLTSPLLAQSNSLSEAIATDYDNSLEALFIDFHKNPELSYKETRTASIIAREWRAAGWTVTEKVGGTGVVAVMKNGEGPTVMLRADMDGLPLLEDTDLDYKSTAKQIGLDGKEKNVMHACGHDVHVTSLIGTARQLAGSKGKWRGTVVLIGQPAEETFGGAKAMLDDGLYSRFPKPDYALGFHVISGIPAGSLSLTPGINTSSTDSVDIIIHGVGTHGAFPHAGKDPIVMGSQIVMALQTLVSREIAPLNPAVVSVGSFQSGFKHNIIPNKAVLQLTVRSDDAETRKKLLDGIKRISKNIARASGMPEDKLPEVNVAAESTPAGYSDLALTQRLNNVFTKQFGKEAILSIPRTGMGGEDFAYFVAPNSDVPGLYFAIGGTSQADLDRAQSGGPPIPAHHSPFFKVTPRESIMMGTEAMTSATWELLQPPSD